MKSITCANQTLMNYLKSYQILSTKKYISSDYDSPDCCGLKDLEYTFGDLDDYYNSRLAKESFNGNYRMYTCRGDKDRDMNIDIYLDKIRPLNYCFN